MHRCKFSFAHVLPLCFLEHIWNKWFHNLRLWVNKQAVNDLRILLDMTGFGCEKKKKRIYQKIKIKSDQRSFESHSSWLCCLFSTQISKFLLVKLWPWNTLRCSFKCISQDRTLRPRHKAGRKCWLIIRWDKQGRVSLKVYCFYFIYKVHAEIRIHTKKIFQWLQHILFKMFSHVESGESFPIRSNSLCFRLQGFFGASLKQKAHNPLW